jgi:hypothetical protein
MRIRTGIILVQGPTICWQLVGKYCRLDTSRLKRTSLDLVIFVSIRVQAVVNTVACVMPSAFAGKEGLMTFSIN